MRRSIAVVAAVIALVLVGTLPADAAVKKVRSRIDPFSIVESPTPPSTITSISGNVVSGNAACLAGRTILTEYKDSGGAVRIGGYTNTSASDGSWTISGASEPSDRPAALILFSKKISAHKVCTGNFISRGPEV